MLTFHSSEYTINFCPSPMTMTNHHASYTTSLSRMPHPEVFMDNVCDFVTSQDYHY